MEIGTANSRIVMRIGLNLLHAHAGIGGVWNYIANLIKALGDYGGANDYVVYCTSHSSELVPNRPGFCSRRVGISGTSRLQRVAYEQTALHYLARRDNLDCMHWFANTVGLVNLVPAVVTFHDLMAFENPREFSLAKRCYLHAMMPYSARHATILLPVSKATGEDLIRRFKVDRRQVVVVPASVGSEFTPCVGERVEQFRHAYMLPHKFWLYVAHCYPHKNHERLFQAYARLKARKHETWPLVLRGEKFGRGELLDRQLEASGIRQHVVWLPELKREEMPLLYSAATRLIFPSLYEGLGLPVLEAISCGLLAVASDIPTNHEFDDSVLSFFAPTDTDAIADAMEQAMCHNILHERCRRQGLASAAEFRPHMMAARLVEAYGVACAAET